MAGNVANYNDMYGAGGYGGPENGKYVCPKCGSSFTEKYDRKTRLWLGRGALAIPTPIITGRKALHCNNCRETTKFEE